MKRPPWHCEMPRRSFVVAWRDRERGGSGEGGGWRGGQFGGAGEGVLRWRCGCGRG